MDLSTFYPIDCLTWMQFHVYRLRRRRASYVVEIQPEGWTITELTVAV